MDPLEEPVVVYRDLGTAPNGLRLAEAWSCPGAPRGPEVAVPPAGAELLWRSASADDGALRVDIPFELAPGAPKLWFLALDEPRGRPAACTLAAFADDAVAEGTILEAHGFAQLGIRADAQLGDVRWFRDGLVHHLQVLPPYRDRDVGTSLLCAAGAWHRARGWPGHPHGEDGRRIGIVWQFLASFRIPRPRPAGDADAQ